MPGAISLHHHGDRLDLNIDVGSDIYCIQCRTKLLLCEFLLESLLCPLGFLLVLFLLLLHLNLVESDVSLLVELHDSH